MQPQPPKSVDPGKVLIGLIDLLANGSAMSAQYERLGSSLGIEEGAPMIVFLSGIKKILRELPEKVFADKNTRIAMVSAVQDALDDAIAAEEEQEEQKQNQEGGN